MIDLRQALATTREHLYGDEGEGGLEQSFAEHTGEYNSERAQFGDAGPGMGLSLARIGDSLAEMRRRHAALLEVAGRSEFIGRFSRPSPFSRHAGMPSGDDIDLPF
tara:strand:+ start:566 stop:883 length:318 start_codon:yes stop_codon:yes gene_type:complete